MAFEFRCVCGSLLTVDDQSIGCPVECPECRDTVIVPDPGNDEDMDEVYGGQEDVDVELEEVGGFENCKNPEYDEQTDLEPASPGTVCPNCQSAEVFLEKKSFLRNATGHFGGAIMGGVVASVLGLPPKVGSDAGSMMGSSKKYICNACGHIWKSVV